jgi:hypothetical protein
MDHDGTTVSRAQLEANLAGKLGDDVFLRDIELIPADVDYDPVSAAALVQDELIAKVPGEPWKGPGT